MISASAVGEAALADEPQGASVKVVTASTYDSNVADSSAAGAALRGIRPEDWIFQPTVDAEIALPVSRQQLFVKGSAGYAFYAHNSQLNGQTIDVQGGLNAHLRDCRLTFAGEWSEEQTKLQDLSVAVNRNIEDTDTIRLEGDCGGPVGFGPSASIVREWSNNSAQQLVASDYRTITATAGIDYRRPTLGSVSLFGSYVQTDLPNRTVAIGPVSASDGYRYYSVGAGFDHRLGGRIESSLRIAYVTLEPYAHSVPGYSGVDLHADVSIRVSGRLNGRLSVVQEPLPTIVSNSTYTLSDSYTVEADYAMSSKVNLKIVASYATNDYSGVALIPGVDIQHEAIWTVTCRSRYQVSRRLSVELWAAYGSRNTDVLLYDYNDNRVGLSLTATI
jgi:hypothetical protein